MRVVNYIDINMRRTILFGFVYSWKQEAPWLVTGGFETRIGFVPPQRLKEGTQMKLWGYKKEGILESNPKKGK